MESRVKASAATQAAELLVFLLLILPSIALSFFPQSLKDAGFVLVAISSILRNVALVALILYFLWRNGESIETLGWRRDKLASNLGIGLLLAPLISSGVAALAVSVQALGLSGPRVGTSFLEPAGPAEMALGVVLVTVVAVSEETIFRGYLMARFTSISGSTSVGVGATSLLFALGHAYEGAAGVVAIGMMGLIFALLMVSRRSLVAPVVIHFINDFLAIVVVPMLAGG